MISYTKRFNIITILLLLFFFLFLGSCKEKKKADPSGIVTYLNGNAFIKNTKSKNDEFTILKLKQKVLQNDTIKTAAGTKVIVQFANLGLFRILPNTILKISQLVRHGKNEMFLEKGGLFSNMLKLKKEMKFQIRTKAAVAGVRGTKFFSNE